MVVSYNSASELSTCIQGAKKAIKQAGVRGDIIVIDNNSQDDSLGIASAAGALTVDNGKNLGFSKGVNIGVRKAYQLGCDTILLLNPDASLLPSSLKPMLEVLHSSADIGAVGPSMVRSDGSLSNEGYYLKTPSLLTVVCFSTWLRPWSLKQRFLMKRYEESDLTQQRDVDQIPGACVLASKKNFQKIGLLDEDFAIWFEDVEWSYRAREKGFRLVFCPDARVVHEGGISFAKWIGLEKSVTFYVSMKTFFRKHKPISLPFVVLALCINAFVVYLKSHDKDQLRFIKRILTQRTGTLPL